MVQLNKDGYIIPYAICLPVLSQQSNVGDSAEKKSEDEQATEKEALVGDQNRGDEKNPERVSLKYS